MKKQIVLLCILLYSLTCFAQIKDMEDAPTTFYQSLFEDFLYNPIDADFVSFEYNMPSCWGGHQLISMIGWIPKGDTNIYRIAKMGYFQPSECTSVQKLDFKTFVKDHLLSSKEKDEKTLSRMDRIAAGDASYHPLIIAAWCHQVGATNLSKQVYNSWKKEHTASSPKEAIKAWKEDLEWAAFAGMVHHYMQRKDLIAERYAQQIELLFPNVYQTYDQAKAIIAELKRKKTVHKFNTKAAEDPLEEGTLPVFDQRILFLIDALDEVDARQWGQPGGVNLADDWRIKALVRLGDPAVPYLIDVIETDKRLTRSVHFWRDFAKDRTVLNVKEAALTAIMSIWQDPLFRPVATGDNFTSRGEAMAQALAQQLREKLKEMEGSSLDERKVEILIDASEKSYIRRRVASELANFGMEHSYGTTVWSDRLSGKKMQTNILIDRWKNPSIAEMIFKAMQEDLTRVEIEDQSSYKDRAKSSIESDYLYALIDLGDKGILDSLRTLYQPEATARMQRKIAYTCYWMGDSTLWEDYCIRLQEHKIQLPPIVYSTAGPTAGDPQNQPGNRELRMILYYLNNINDSISKKTLQLIASPQHPWYKWVELRLVQLCGGYDHDVSEYWYNPMFCFDIYERKLKDKNDSDIEYKYYAGSGITSIMDWGGASGFRLHDMWDQSDYSTDKDLALRARICDAVGGKLYHLIFGIPVVHVHLKDKDERIERQIEFLRLFKDKLRPLTSEEYNTVNDLYLGTRYIPELPRLERPATKEDVAIGNAIFSLEQSTLADIKLPAWAIIEKYKDQKKPMKAYIVQAEVDKKGELIYGAFTEDGPKTFRSNELIDIQSYEEKK